ncbi:Histidine kinase CKI1 [Linum perenne]
MKKPSMILTTPKKRSRMRVLFWIGVGLIYCRIRRADDDPDDAEDKKGDGEEDLLDWSMFAAAVGFEHQGIGLLISFAIVVVLQKSPATHRSRTIAFVLLLISIFGSMLLLVAKDAIRERELRSELLKQMKATEKAEMKSLSKTLSIATASHNIRNMLTPIFGFIEKRVADFPPTVARATNLKSIHDSTKDISGYLSHILDASKLEE